MKNLLIIGGASKSGTTALYYYFSQHPEVCLSEKKELHFFSGAELEQNISGPGDKFVMDEITKTFDEYRLYYDCDEEKKITLDVSPSYLYYYKTSTSLIKQYTDGAKLVFLLRNPIDKVFSQYMHLLGEGREELTFEDALAKESERKSMGYSDIWLYKESGYYADSVKYFIDNFGQDNVKFYYYDEFLKSPKVILRDICQFSGISSDFKFEDLVGVNRSGKPKSKILAKLLAPNQFTNLLRRIIPMKFGAKVKNFIKDLNTGKKEKLSSDIKEKLFEDYKADIQKVEKILGKKSGWLD